MRFKSNLYFFFTKGSLTICVSIPLVGGMMKGKQREIKKEMKRTIKKKEEDE